MEIVNKNCKNYLLINIHYGIGTENQIIGEFSEKKKKMKTAKTDMFTYEICKLKKPFYLFNANCSSYSGFILFLFVKFILL